VTTTVQLRRYRMEPGRLAAFLDWFPALVPVREQFGFRVLFAYADAEHETFTWAVEHDGDDEAFTAAERVYNDSAERAAVFADFPAGIAAMELGLVKDVLAR
jgi:hypothetical protein